MKRRLEKLEIKNHPILGNISFSFLNPNTNKPYSIVAFVGENGCGKTTLLNEIFNYEKSQYIVRYEEDDPIERSIAFLRQGQFYYSAMDHIKKLINGNDASYPSVNNRMLESIERDKKIIPGYHGFTVNTKVFEDDTLSEIFDKGKNSKKFIPGGSVTKLIDGKEGDDEYDKYSSGQQELIFKFQTLSEARSCNYLLMDEPETSLHPRWQKIIIDFILSFVNLDTVSENDVEYDMNPQIFIATHSEKILESILKQKDALIIRLYRNKDKKIKHEPIQNMDLVLPRHTLAELDYVIFKIDSFEYCSELYDLFEWRNPDKKERALDTLIKNSDFYDEKIHYKEWFNERFGEVSSHNIATYCRNYFHHPKDRIEPTEEELHNAILLLRNILSKQN